VLKVAPAFMVQSASDTISVPNDEEEDHGISLREAFWTWARIAGLSFGGPAGQIAVMHRILVEEKRWIGETRFLHALNYCMLLPGPEAHKLAVYIGWLLHRMRGGIMAGTLFILPGLFALSVLSFVYVIFGSVGIVQGLFFGLKAAVLAIVFQGVLRVGKRALNSRAQIGIAAAAFVALFLFAVPFPLVIGAAAAAGLLGQTLRLSWFEARIGRGAAGGEIAGTAAIDAAFASGVPTHVRPSFVRFIGVLAIGGSLWLLPLAALLILAGPQNTFAAVAAFNAKMAVVTFGGAYAILAYMAQQAVDHFHWVKPGEMLVGLGFAETTPGPLISVVQFVGFMAAFRDAKALNPYLAGTLGGLLAMWMTFVPSFLWVFLGGPYFESLSANKALNAALSAITAAVVGVILNLAVWLGLRTLFGQIETRQAGVLTLNLPILQSLNLPALILAVVAMAAIFRFQLGMLPVLAGSSLLGAVYYLATGAH
jgi:chromate transporter